MKQDCTTCRFSNTKGSPKKVAPCTKCEHHDEWLPVPDKLKCSTCGDSNAIDELFEDE